MSQRLILALKMLWASPVTIVGLLYVTLFGLFGWYKWIGRKSEAFVWSVNINRAPSWLLKAWLNWSAHAIGNVVIVKLDINTERGKRLMIHELEHVHQCMRLGAFFPLLYGLCWLAIKLGCPRSHPYYSNVFEIEARRAARQVVDVEGMVKKVKSV